MAADWIKWTFAIAAIALAGYHCARLVWARRRHRTAETDVDLTHAAMGAAMTIMLLGPLTPAVGRCLACGFALPTLWFTARTAHHSFVAGRLTIGRDAGPAIAGAAMVYLLIVASAPLGATGMGSMPMLPLPGGPGAGNGPGRTIAGLLIVAMGAVAIATAARLRRRHLGCTPQGLAPATTAGCQLAMSATTIYMLALMV